MDTIAAQATPPGNGGVGIIRISGPEVVNIAQKILGKLPNPRHADYLPFLGDSGEVIDYGIAIYFKAPHSFTGEDVLELQGHGGQVVLDILLSKILALGVRPAQPGEFSKRAFLNDKMDLAQAEAVADLITASSSTAAKSAMRSLSGEFSNVIHQLLEELIQLRMYIESAIDFAEEEIDFLADVEIKNRFAQLISRLKETFIASQQGCLLNEGMTVVILGQPNTGKSSLLNRLTQRETAIVTDIAGTTRDIIREHIQLDGLPIHVIDTAGLREQGDVVEKEGMRRAWNEVKNADRVLFLADDSKGLDETDRRLIADIPDELGVSIVFNKIDISKNIASNLEFEGIPAVRISAKTGEGLDLLSCHLRQIMGMQTNPEGVFLARRRHIDALERALDSVQVAQDQLLSHYAGELVAEDLRQAQGALNEITGEFDNEDLLGRIFSSFCIGK